MLVIVNKRNNVFSRVRISFSQAVKMTHHHDGGNEGCC